MVFYRLPPQDAWRYGGQWSGWLARCHCDRRSWSCHTSDLAGILAASLQGVWPYRVSGRAGWPDVRQWLSEIAKLICSFYPSVAARSVAVADTALCLLLLLLLRSLLRTLWVIVFVRFLRMTV